MTLGALFQLVKKRERRQSLLQARHALRRYAAGREPGADGLRVPKARDDQVSVGNRSERAVRQIVRSANRQIEESAAAAIVDDPDKGEVSRLEADVGNLGHIARAIEHDTLPAVRVGLAAR